jgi:hypothetical protein
MTETNYFPAQSATIDYLHSKDRDRSIVWMLDTSDGIYNFFIENLPIDMKMSDGLEDMPTDLNDEDKMRYIRQNQRHTQTPGNLVIEIVPGSYSKMCTIINNIISKIKDLYKITLIIRIGKCDKIDPTFYSGLVNLSRGFIQGASSVPYPKIEPFPILILSTSNPPPTLLDDINIYIACKQNDTLVDGKLYLSSRPRR